jgi:hypothetical protein
MDDAGTLYVCAERDNDEKLVNRLSILSFALNANDTDKKLSAKMEWDFTVELSATIKKYAFEGNVALSGSVLMVIIFAQVSFGSRTPS